MADQSKPRGRRDRRSRQRQQREAQQAQQRKRYLIGGGVIAAVILFIAVLSIIELVGNDEDEDTDTFPTVQAAPAGYDHIASEPYLLGDPDAPIHLVEWSDYQ